MTQQLATRKQEPKTVTVLARIQFKANGYVLYKVQSSDGASLYNVSVINGHATACTCASHKPCYHMKGVEAKEQQRALALATYDIVGALATKPRDEAHVL